MSVATHGFSRWLATPVALALILGCGTTPNAPNTLERSLQLDLSLSSTSGRPGEPITARASVRNVGLVPVWHLQFCYGATPAINVWELDRHNVEEACGQCPDALCLGCVAQPTRLNPGEIVEIERTFEGTLYTCEGPYDVADGEYTVELLFNGRLGDASGAPVTLTRNAVLRWSTR